MKINLCFVLLYIISCSQGWPQTHYSDGYVIAGVRPQLWILLSQPLKIWDYRPLPSGVNIEIVSLVRNRHFNIGCVFV